MLSSHITIRNTGAVIAQSVLHWATGWTIGVLGFDSRRGLENFLFTTASRTALGPTQPPIQWVTGALSLGVKLTTHINLVPRSRMRGAIPPFPQYVFMAWCLVKHRDNFTFCLLPSAVRNMQYSSYNNLTN
jgi:hypothetical protein